MKRKRVMSDYYGDYILQICMCTLILYTCCVVFFFFYKNLFSTYFALNKYYHLVLWLYITTMTVIECLLGWCDNKRNNMSWHMKLETKKARKKQITTRGNNIWFYKIFYNYVTFFLITKISNGLNGKFSMKRVNIRIIVKKNRMLGKA